MTAFACRTCHAGAETAAGERRFTVEPDHEVGRATPIGAPPAGRN